jgi:hypothetical protein
MKKKLAIVILFIGLISLSFIFKFNSPKPAINYQTEQDCPPEGNAKSERISKLNVFKNRIVFPTKKDIDTLITLRKMLEPGNDVDRWQNTKAVCITGYVYEVKSGGQETCNCKDPNVKDTHIEILLDPMKSEKMQRMVVEVTPRIRNIMKAKGINWETKTLRDKLLGRWVKFEGWLFFDEEHANAAENTKPGKPRNWRATAWEIHPVTNIEVTVKPKN